MNRRIFLLAATAALGLAPLRGFADVEDALLGRLRAEGFGAIKTERTWLGRVHISASGQLGQREIILNPRTGEVLRDIIVTPDGRVVSSSLVETGAGASGDGGKSGSGSNSGSGGGSGSGSGSGGGSGSGSGAGSGDDGSDDSGDDGGDDKGGSSGSDGGGDDD